MLSINKLNLSTSFFIEPLKQKFSGIVAIALVALAALALILTFRYFKQKDHQIKDLSQKDDKKLDIQGEQIPFKKTQNNPSEIISAKFFKEWDQRQKKQEEAFELVKKFILLNSIQENDLIKIVNKNGISQQVRYSYVDNPYFPYNVHGYTNESTHIVIPTIEIHSMKLRDSGKPASLKMKGKQKEQDKQPLSEHLYENPILMDIESIDPDSQEKEVFLPLKDEVFADPKSKSHDVISQKLDLEEIGLSKIGIGAVRNHVAIQLGKHRIYLLGEHHNSPESKWVKGEVRCGLKKVSYFQEGTIRHPIAEQMENVSLVPGQAPAFGLEESRIYWLTNALEALYFHTASHLCEKINDSVKRMNKNLIVSLRTSSEGRLLWECIGEKHKDNFDWQTINTLLQSDDIENPSRILERVDQIYPFINDSHIGFGSLLKSLIQLLTDELQLSKSENEIIEKMINFITASWDPYVKNPIPDPWNQYVTWMCSKRSLCFAKNIIQQLPQLPSERPIVAIMGKAHVNEVASFLQQLHHTSK